MFALFMMLSMLSVVMVAGVFDLVAAEEYRVAPKGSSTMTQDGKILLLIVFVLTRLFRDGVCHAADVEDDAVAAGLKRRTELQLSVGVSGRGGLCLLRGRDKSVLLCRDNVVNMIRRLGAAGFASWLAKEGISEEQFGVWFGKLPSA